LLTEWRIFLGISPFPFGFSIRQYTLNIDFLKPFQVKEIAITYAYVEIKCANFSSVIPTLTGFMIKTQMSLRKCAPFLVSLQWMAKILAQIPEKWLEINDQMVGK
jgi:hypothetical protein